MKFLYCFPYSDAPLPDELTTGSAVGTLAAAAEAAGFDALGGYEHPAPSERWRQSGGHDAPDPYLLLAYAAAVTQRVRLVTYLSPLAYRNPLLLAKTVATLDRLAGGRFTLGTGAGYLKSEFAALGADFENRNTNFDEAIEVLRQAWSGEPVNYEGNGFTARNVRSLPGPIQKPHPPLWIGGNGRRARQRAAVVGGAWAPTPTTPELEATARVAPIRNIKDLEPLIADLHERATAQGRQGEVEVVFTVVPPRVDVPMGEHVDIVRRLEKVGVGWAVVHGMGATVEAASAWIARYGATVIREVNGHQGDRH